MIHKLTPMLRVPEDDVQNAIDWYQNIGFTLVATNQIDDNPVDWGHLRYDEVEMMVTGGGISHDDIIASLYCYTDDVESLFAALTDQGIEATLETAFHGMREINLVDPYGFGLVFAERVAEQPASIRHLDTDPLTGFRDRHAFDASLLELINGDVPVSVALLDVDLFAAVNKTSGREAGDETLRQLSACLKNNVATDPSVKVYRLGGDEFSIVMPGCEKEQAFLNLERTRAAFDNLEQTQDFNPHPTITIGVESYPDDGTTAQEVLRKADDALFRAKNTGRNKVGLAREEKKVPKTSHYTQGQLDRLSALS
ncbi:MAG: diguanylate cyclase, partial [Pseudomonadota bacterium]